MATTKYIWDVVTDNVMMEKDGAGSTQAVYTQEPYQYGRLISQRRGGQTSYYHYDGNGNTRALTDESQNVTDTYTYTAFGDDVATTGTTKNRYRFGGQYGYQYNLATDEYYVRGPVYQPKQGRWQSDARGHFAQDTNLYTYADNAPQLPDTTTAKAKDKKSESKPKGGGNGFYQHFDRRQHRPRTHSTCGGARAFVVWKFKRGSKVNGWVIQKVQMRYNVFYCNGNPIKQPRSVCYFEAWQVIDGKVYAGKSKGKGNPHKFDRFNIPDFQRFAKDNSRGDASVSGDVMFVHDYDFDKDKGWSFRNEKGHFPEAARLPSRPCDNVPKGWNAKNTITRKLVAKWNCCGCSKKVTNVGESTGWQQAGDTP